MVAKRVEDGPDLGVVPEAFLLELLWRRQCGRARGQGRQPGGASRAPRQRPSLPWRCGRDRTPARPEGASRRRRRSSPRARSAGLPTSRRAVLAASLGQPVVASGGDASGTESTTHSSTTRTAVWPTKTPWGTAATSKPTLEPHPDLEGELEGEGVGAQLTRFVCGSLAVGFLANHAVADRPSTSDFRATQPLSSMATPPRTPGTLLWRCTAPSPTFLFGS